MPTRSPTVPACHAPSQLNALCYGRVQASQPPAHSAAVRSIAGGDGQLTPRLLGAAAHVNLPDADRAGAAMRQTVGMRVAGVSTADTHSDWGWRRRLVASRSAKPAPQHVTETLPFRHHAAPSSSLTVRRLSYAMHTLPRLVVRAGVGKLRTWRSTLREVRVEVVGDARPTSPTTRSFPRWLAGSQASSRCWTWRSSPRRRGRRSSRLAPSGSAHSCPCWWAVASWLPWAPRRPLNVAASPGMVSLGDAAVRGRAGVGQARASAFMWFSSVCAAWMSAATLST